MCNEIVQNTLKSVKMQQTHGKTEKTELRDTTDQVLDQSLSAIEPVQSLCTSDVTANVTSLDRKGIVPVSEKLVFSEIDDSLEIPDATDVISSDPDCDLECNSVQLSE